MPKNTLAEVLSVSRTNWNNWHWQMKQKSVCNDLDALANLGLVAQGYKPGRPIGLTPYQVKLLLELQKTDPWGFQAEMLQTFPPQGGKKRRHQWAWAKRHDLLSSRIWERLPASNFLRVLFTGRGSDTEVRGLEKMYPKIDAVVVSSTCARHCTFCFRETGDPEGEATQTCGGINNALEAVRHVVEAKTPHVLITGGDPLTRSNEQLRQLLAPLVQSGAVQVLRLATRMVTDLPMRFYDEELLAMLKDFAQQMKSRHASFRLVTQVNHACELTPEAIVALDNIQTCGVEVMSQTTSLRGVNDDPAKLQKLFMELDRLGVRNHHFFHTMPVPGAKHLQVPYRRFQDLLASLHQWLPGTAIPHAAVATLVGKMPISPSGRWIWPVPFTDRLLCKSFRGEWYLFRDSWDVWRHLREAGMVVATVLIILMASWPLTPSRQDLPPLDETQAVTRVAVLADEISYPDYWARQPFKPFIQRGTLYLPTQGLAKD